MRISFSRTTFVAGLSPRIPTNAGWRICPSLVHSVNFTSQTSFGLTQVVDLLVRYRLAEWLFWTHQRFEPCVEALEACGAKTGSGVADVAPSMPLAQRQHQCAEMLARSPRSSESDDHHFLAPRRLDLHPIARAPAGMVAALRPLAHDALKPAPLGGAEGSHAISLHVLAEADRGASRERGPKQALALQQRQPAQVLAIEEQQIEHVITQPRLFLARVLEQLETRSAFFIERDELAIEDRAAAPLGQCAAIDG